MAARGEGGQEEGHAERKGLSPAAEDPVRARLRALVAARGEDFSGLSRLIGRNPSYIQQFLTRGTPRRLAEEDRRRLATHFGVDEAELGAPAPAASSGPPGHRLLPAGADSAADAHFGPRDWLLIPFLGRTGAPMEDEPHDAIAFAAGFLRALGAGRTGALAAVRVEGDTMAPTLLPGDQLLLDADALHPLRDGLHVLRIDGALAARRVAIHPVTHRLTLLSDNSAYPACPDCAPAALHFIGRVVWIGRTLP